ncbi:fimbrial protein [Providencia vermicola]|uniref:fimbrial protein n=1 Tax=Providencia TaxID=586 RepID=UPI0023491433|nr:MULTISPECIES: fimbrial protein [unclassified Providencia]
MKKNHIRGIGLILSGLVSLNSYAVDVKIKGNLIKNPPCHITGPDGPDQPIKIQFGEMGITKINGENYQQNFTLKVNCEDGLGEGVLLYLEYRGIKSPFDNNAIQAYPAGLGIRLYHGGVVIPPNTGTKIIMSNNDTAELPLTAIPVKDNRPSVVLREGDFTASATIEILYP